MSSSPSPFFNSLLLAGIEQTIVLIESRISEQKGKMPAVVRGGDGEDSLHIDELEVFLQRLQQIQIWLAQDHQLLTVVDEHIGQQARLFEHHRLHNERTLAMITTLAGAILGWLLSGVATPLQVLHHLR